MTFNSKENYFLHHSKPNALNCSRSLQQFGYSSSSLIPAVLSSLCLFLRAENWFTRVVILIWHKNITSNSHHLGSFVVLMAIHYGFQDKFMFPFNVTKHRNKLFFPPPLVLPSAPYLCRASADAQTDQMARSHLVTRTGSFQTIKILGTFSFLFFKLFSNYCESVRSHRETTFLLLLRYIIYSTTSAEKNSQKMNRLRKLRRLRLIMF